MQVIVFVCIVTRNNVVSDFLCALLCEMSFSCAVLFVTIWCEVFGFYRFPKELSRGLFIGLIVIYVVKQYGISHNLFMAFSFSMLLWQPKSSVRFRKKRNKSVNDLLETRSIGTRHTRTTVNPVPYITTWTIAASHALLCVVTLDAYLTNKTKSYKKITCIDGISYIYYNNNHNYFVLLHVYVYEEREIL